MGVYHKGLTIKDSPVFDKICLANITFLLTNTD